MAFTASILANTAVAMDSKRPFRGYGLIKKNVEKPVRSSCVFDDTDDSEQQNTSNSKSSFDSGKVRKETRLRIEKALIEDPSIFEYDSVYDDFKNEKKSEPKVKNARYVPTLLQAAENRKKEQERRLERKIQKEREDEGDEYKDKEAFVTTAYKEKLIEMQAENEKEMKEKKLEELLDVKKQNDLSGFYRHLLNQQTTEKSDEIIEKPTFTSKKVNRNLRTRDRSSSESSENSPVRVASHSNHDKCDDHSKPVKKTKKTNDFDEMRKEKKDTRKEAEDKPANLISQNEIQRKEEINESTVDTKEYLISLFTKRTVGEIFDDKRRQYLLRKQSRKQN